MSHAADEALFAGSRNATRVRCFVAVSPGLEPWLRDEISELGLKPELRAGGVEVSGTFLDVMRVCVQSRMAESVRVRLKSFKAANFDALEAQLPRLPWHAYLRPNVGTHISVTCHKSRLYHSDAVLERCQRAIETRLKSPLSITPRAQAEQTVFLRLDHDNAETSIDASGELLHRRGYRTHVAHAPLRETLAAALVRIAHSNPARIAHSNPARIANADNATLWDPFCGSGTVMLEWLAQRQGSATFDRSFAFERWPIFEKHADDLRALIAAQPAYRAGQRHAYGSDIDARAITAAQANVAQFGAGADVDLIASDFRDAASKVPHGSAIISNPPYGKRVGHDKAVMALHRHLETLLKARKDLRPVVLACGYGPFLGAMTLPWQRVASTKNGGLPITILRLE